MDTLKAKLALLGTVILAVLQSCSANMEAVFHKDKTITTQMEVISPKIVKKVVKSDNKPSQIFSKDWKNIYEQMQEEKRQGKSNEIDSLSSEEISLYKRTYTKGLFDGEELTGIAYKMEKVNVEELKTFSKKNGELSKFSGNSDFNWDGKTLSFDVVKKPKKVKGEDNEEVEKIIEMLKDVKVNMVYKFDEKIKSISINHPNVIKVDDHTIKVLFDPNVLMEYGTELKNAKTTKITVVTE